MEHLTATQADEATLLLPLRVGEYLCSDRDLFYVERISEDGAMVEDCRTGVRVDLPFSRLLQLRRVRES